MFPSIPNRIRYFAVIALVLGTAIGLISAEKSPWSKRDKAYFADADTLAFVRPGLKTEIQSVEIAADGTVTAQVKFTDEQGVGLDRNGIYTPGAINGRWTIARIPAGKSQYLAYTTNSNNQASKDSGGSRAERAIGE